MGEKRRKDVISDAWKLHKARNEIALKQKSRLAIIEEVIAENKCVCPNRGLWFTLAIDLCYKNNLYPEDVGKKMYKCLVGGRKKHNNLIIIGESNCAKTFLLEPLNKVFKEGVQNAPASSVFGWLGVNKKRVIYLNDFRWVNPVSQNKGVITWDAFLRLLEGGICDLPAPMNSHSTHIRLEASNDVPVLCTSIGPIKFYLQRENEPQTSRHTKENKMMQERWMKPIELTHEFEEDKKIVVDPCGWCFCKFVVSYGGQ